MGWTPPPIPGRLSLDGEPPFVGRRAELEVLEQAWQAVEAGRRQVVFIGGEPGAGKTRLVAEVASAVATQGIGVLFGTSFVDYGTPYQPFVECLDHLFRTDPDPALTELIPGSARHLIRVCPRIIAHRPDLDMVVDEVAEDRAELFKAFRDLFQSLSAEQPLALVLEDTHWALEPTRQLLHYLAEATDESALLILVTYRTTHPDRSHDLTRVMADLYRHSGVNRIDLAGLGVADIAEYLTAWRGSNTTDAQRTAVLLRDLTGGNPFFIRELLAQRGASSTDLDYSPTATVLDALGIRLNSLSPPAFSVLELAAIVGDEFDTKTLVFADGDPDRVLAALDESTRAGLVAHELGDASGFRFRHSLTREAVIAAMSPSRRAEAHAAIATAVEAVWPETGNRHAVLAHHLSGVGVGESAERAVAQALLAAEHAEMSLAFEDAASWFRRAADMDGGSRRVEWLLAAAHNLVRAGDFSSAIPMYADLTSATNPRLAAEAAVGFEDASWRRGATGPACAAVLDRALAAIDEDPKDPLYVLLLARKARALMYSGSPDAAQFSVKAISLATAMGDSDLIGKTLAATVDQLLVPGQIHEMLRRCREYLEWAEKSGSHDDRAFAAGLLANLAYMGGDPAGLDEARARFEESAVTGHLSFWRFMCEPIVYTDHYIAGDLETAAEMARKLRRAGLVFSPEFPEGPFGVQMFMIERERGRLEAVRHVAESIQDAEHHWVPGVLGLYTELGILDRAKDLVELIFKTQTRARRASIDWPVVLAIVADAVVAIGDRRLAEMWRPALQEYSGLNLMAGAFVAVFGSADRYIAQIDVLLGLDSAEEHFRMALDMDRRMRSTLHEVETLIAYAAYLDRSSDHRRLARATEYRQRARSIAERKGLTRQLKRLAESTTVRSDRPAGLTPRELEVLRLIAEGMSNKEIAERLFISQNTAANHIRRILTKTQAANRTKAAIFAAENGLLS